MRSRHKESVVLTTGDVSRATGLSIQKIGQLIDAGILKGFKIPGSTHRRICRDEFEKFCKQYNIPVELMANADR